MKYLLFSWEDITPELEQKIEDDICSMSDELFEEIADTIGTVIHTHEEFEAQFNSEKINTETMQLRIIEK